MSETFYHIMNCLLETVKFYFDFDLTLYSVMPLIKQLL